MEIGDSPGTKKAKREAEFANLKASGFESFPASYSQSRKSSMHEDESQRSF